MIAIMSAIVQRLLAMTDAERELAAGQTLFRAGEPVRHLYVVLAGSVRLVRNQVNGTAVVLQRARANQLLAEASLFAARYHCDAVSEQPTRLARIAKAKILQAQREDPAWLVELAAHLAGEVQQARARAELLSLRTVRERLDGWLALHGALPPRGRWVDVAQEIGVTREALYRELARSSAPPEKSR
jgi:CRP/FNR family transcriptional regulator, dissimilatory nitrate respiration regulator